MSVISSSLTSMVSSSGRKGKRKQEVLSEEDYSSQLEHVIEQQFFPHLPKMRSILDYLDANETFDINTLRETYKMLFPSLPRRFSDSASHTTTVSTHTGLSTIPENNDELLNDATTLNSSKLTISQFFSRFISEDNQSYQVLQDQAVEAHRRKFHWMYEAVDCLPLLTNGNSSDPATTNQTTSKRKAGMLMLYYLGDKVLSASERQELDNILSRQYDEQDTRPNIHNPQWGFKVRNAMFFTPELKDSREICQVGATPGTDMLSILPGQTAPNQLLMLPPPPKTHQSQGGRGGIQEKHIQAREIHALSNNLLEDVDAFLRGQPGSNSLNHLVGDGLTPLEAIHTPSTVSSFATDDPRIPFLPTPSSRPYREVAMSPMPLIGSHAKGALASPLMTWGEVGGTPLRIDMPPTASSASSSGPQFHFLPLKAREQIAIRLSEKLRNKKRSTTSGQSTGGVTPSPSPSMHSALSTPLSVISRPGTSAGSVATTSGMVTAKARGTGGERGRMSDLTPAAQELAQRILKSQKPK